jgi:hypothetical protein
MYKISKNMKLTTKIIDKKTGKEFIVSADWTHKTIANCAGDSQADIYATHSETGTRFRAGSLVYTKKGDHIHVEYIQNWGSASKHVGTAGIEYLLRIPGVTKITTDASYSSHIFYWKLGFRVPPERAIRTPLAYEQVERLYRKYLQAIEEENVAEQLELYETIVLHEDFDMVLSHAQAVARSWETIARHEQRVLSLEELALTSVTKEDLYAEGDSGLTKQAYFMLVMRVGLYEDGNVALASNIYYFIDAHSLWSDYEKYCSAQEPQAKETLRQLIVNNRCFQYVLDTAVKEAGEDLDPEKDFETIMQEGDYRSEESIEKFRINIDRVDTSNIGAIILELSPDAINNLKAKFQILDPQAEQPLAPRAEADHEFDTSDQATSSQYTM